MQQVVLDITNTMRHGWAFGVQATSCTRGHPNLQLPKAERQRGRERLACSAGAQEARPSKAHRNADAVGAHSCEGEAPLAAAVVVAKPARQ